jgi:hypothetical protein
MGVLNKLKSRMKGPSKTDFKKLVGKYDKGSGNGVSAVEAGLRAGQSMYAGVQDYNIADDLAQMGATIGSSIPGKDKKVKTETTTTTETPTTETPTTEQTKATSNDPIVKGANAAVKAVENKALEDFNKALEMYKKPHHG